jgi:hypothetical protein
VITLPWLVVAGYLAFLAAVVVILRAGKGRGRAERAADARIIAPAAPRPPARPARPTYAPTAHHDQAHAHHRATTRSVR